MKSKAVRLASLAIAVSVSLSSLSTLSLIRAEDTADADAAAGSGGDYVVKGNCVFSNQWSGASCMEFRDYNDNGEENGDGYENWSEDSMKERCAIELENSVTTGDGERCAFEEDDDDEEGSMVLSGWCVKTVEGLTEATSMMLSSMADCDMNSMACENFVQGTFEPNVEACSASVNSDDDNDAVDITTTVNTDTEEEGGGTAGSSSCDESMTNPTAMSCPKVATMTVSYDTLTVDCGEAISLQVAGTVPSVHMIVNDDDDDEDKNIVDPEAYYALLLVDTSNSMVHPILHYGAVNIPGTMLLDEDGLDLMSDAILDGVFSDYRGPNPPSPNDPWATPNIEKQLFAYEFMLGKQSTMIEVPDVSSTMNFDYEDFFNTEIGSSYDNLISSMYFLSGWCVQDDGNNESTATTTTTTDIMIEDFATPQYLWESYMMDGDQMEGMGSNMFDDNGNPKYSYNFSGYDNEFKDTDYGDRYNDMMSSYGGNNNSNNTNNTMRAEYYDRIAGSSMEIVDDVMVLTANITAPPPQNNNDGTANTWSSMMGGDGMGGMGSSMVTMTARGKFPDLTSCDGMKFQAMLSVDDDDDDDEETNNNVNWDDFKYRIEFGYEKLPESVFGFGYRADLIMPQQDDYDEKDSETDNVVSAVTRSESLFTDVIIPFEDFTLDWNWRTGEIVTSCDDNGDYCPDEGTLKNLETMTITAVGNTNGIPVHLHIKSIMGTGCDADAAAAAASMTDGGATAGAPDGQWTCASASSSLSSTDEITIESMSNPQFNWMTQNDPVMGGESYSSIEMVEADGIALFTGEVKDVPFLGVPGFIQMESRGGKGQYPDVSCCDALKLNIMSKDEYTGYRVAFGTERSKTGFFAMGHKGNFDAPVGDFDDVIIPFNMFSVEWDEATGNQIVTCADDPSVCPSDSVLKNMETISIWGEGVGGTIELQVKSISAIGCSGGDGEMQLTGEDDSIPPRTNEAIEAWKVENASLNESSSSMNKISLLLCICTMVVTSLFLVSV